MKKILLLLGSGLLLASCASPEPMGTVYTNITRPIAANNNVKITKTGTAVSHSYLAIVATGDASVEKAKAAGGITNVSTVDYSSENILGVYGTYTTTVKGN